MERSELAWWMLEDAISCRRAMDYVYPDAFYKDQGVEFSAGLLVWHPSLTLSIQYIGGTPTWLRLRRSGGSRISKIDDHISGRSMLRRENTDEPRGHSGSALFMPVRIDCQSHSQTDANKSPLLTPSSTTQYLCGFTPCSCIILSKKGEVQNLHLRYSSETPTPHMVCKSRFSQPFVLR